MVTLERETTIAARLLQKESGRRRAEPWPSCLASVMARMRGDDTSRAPSRKSICQIRYNASDSRVRATYERH